MVSRWTRSRTIQGLCLLGFTVFITGCNPAAYKIPAQNFHAGTVALKEAYFLEWDISHRATIDEGDLEDHISLWGMPDGGDASDVQRVSDEMAARRTTDIHEGLRPLREQAFAALEGYAETLVSLASDEPTEAIVSELNGLVQDINDVLTIVSKTESLKRHADKVEAYVGPLQQYLDVLTEVLRLVSGIIRERAIIQTIGQSNDSVLALLSVLKSEAIMARENTYFQIETAREALDTFLASPPGQNVTNATKATIAEKIAGLQALEDRIRQSRTEEAFDLAVEAQGALIKKAVLKNPTDWAIQIRQFREKVAAIKRTLETIDSEM